MHGATQVDDDWPARGRSDESVHVQAVGICRRLEHHDQSLGGEHDDTQRRRLGVTPAGVRDDTGRPGGCGLS